MGLTLTLTLILKVPHENLLCHWTSIDIPTRPSVFAEGFFEYRMTTEYAAGEMRMEFQSFPFLGRES